MENNNQPNLLEKILNEGNENPLLNNQEEQKSGSTEPLKTEPRKSTPEQIDFIKNKIFTNNLDELEKQKVDGTTNYHKISIAPMLDITNKYFRVFMRYLTRYSTLYTEMINVNAILHVKFGFEEYLRFFPYEHPIVVQLGGSETDKLVQCVKYCQQVGYDEVNLNVGCPSPRVQKGSFGAILMKEPEKLAATMKEMINCTSIPVTVKCRLGVDDFDSYDFAKNFIDVVSKQGQVKHFIVHARKAFLQGLDPDQNRSVPPLHYDWVVQLAKEYPDLQFSINGGFKTTDSITEILKDENNLKGCMVGRAAYSNPWILSDFDRQFYGKKNPGLSRKDILESWADFGDYIMQQDKQPVTVPKLVKPIINLFTGQKHNNKYRRFLSDACNYKHLDTFSEFIYTLVDSLEKYNPQVLNELPPEFDKILL